MPPLLKSGDQRRANEPRRTANEYVQNLLLSPSRDEGMVARPREQVEDLAHKHEPPGTPGPALLVGKGGVSTGSSAYIMYAYTMCAHRWVVRNVSFGFDKVRLALMLERLIVHFVYMRVYMHSYYRAVFTWTAGGWRGARSLTWWRGP
jgi:hypothetical protein